MSSMLTSLKKESDKLWLNDVSAECLQQSLIDLNSAYTNFFRRKKGFPNFKSKRNCNHYRAINSVVVDQDKCKIRLPKIGWVNFFSNRKYVGKFKSVTISMTPTMKFFISINVDDGKDVIDKPEISYDTSICRADYLHKCSISLVRRYDTICVEDLNVKGMERNHHLAKSITDASWGSFVSMLTYKAEWNGKKVVKIDRYFPSSQTCNVCGYVNKQTKDFSVREWECPVCHTHHNRDVNAAINILRFGLNHISAGTVDYTGGEGVRTNLLKGRSSAKPEAHESLARG